MRLSTEARAAGFFDRYEYPEWLRTHSLTVGRVAGALARAHAQGGAAIDAESVALAGYLHDIGRSPRYGDERGHSVRSAAIVREEGLPELAELVRRHPVYAALDPDFAPRDLAERIVYYADRRSGQTVVTLEERIRGQVLRHPQYADLQAVQLEAARAIERLIFADLPFGPGELAERVP